jgi:hypothetical protein
MGCSLGLIWRELDSPRANDVAGSSGSSLNAARRWCRRRRWLVLPAGRAHPAACTPHRRSRHGRRACCVEILDRLRRHVKHCLVGYAQGSGRGVVRAEETSRSRQTSTLSWVYVRQGVSFRWRSQIATCRVVHRCLVGCAQGSGCGVFRAPGHARLDVVPVLRTVRPDASSRRRPQIAPVGSCIAALLAAPKAAAVTDHACQSATSSCLHTEFVPGLRICGRACCPEGPGRELGGRAKPPCWLRPRRRSWIVAQ